MLDGQLNFVVALLSIFISSLTSGKHMNFYLMNELTGTESGPLTLPQIQEMVRTGKIKKNSLIRKADSKQWERAGGPLAKLFQQAELDKAKEKKRTAHAKEEAKKAAAEDKAIKINKKTAAKRAKALRANQQGAATREYNRGSLGQKIFGQLKPSPYWGFQVQGQIINVTIGIVMVGAVLGFLTLIVLAIISIVASDLDAGARLLLFGASVMQAFFLLIGSFFLVALLVFYRNLIDWLIDMEGHANALRKHFER